MTNEIRDFLNSERERMADDLAAKREEREDSEKQEKKTRALLNPRRHRKCAECGRLFYTGAYKMEEYAYQEWPRLYFCGWNCQCAWRKKHPKLENTPQPAAPAAKKKHDCDGFWKAIEETQQETQYNTAGKIIEHLQKVGALTFQENIDELSKNHGCKDYQTTAAFLKANMQKKEKPKLVKVWNEKHKQPERKHR